MEGNVFQRMLLDASVLAMGCDGDVDPREVSAIRELAQSAPYFEGIETNKEIDSVLSNLREKGIQAIEDFLDTVIEATLSEKQERRMFEVLLQVVEADGEVRPKEKRFLAEIRDALGTDEALFVRHFPTHLSTLSGLSAGAGTTPTPFADLPKLPDGDPGVFDESDLAEPSNN